MATESLSPDSLLVQTNLSGAVTDIQDDPDSPDSSWLTATDDTANTVTRTSFATPSGTPNTGADLQEFRLWIRRTANSTREPSVTIELYENGSLVTTITSNAAVVSSSGEIHSATWDATNLSNSDGSGVEVRVAGASTGGPANQRNTVEVGAIEWNADVAGSTTAQESVTDGADLGDTADESIVATESVTDGVSLGDSGTAAIEFSIDGDGVTLGDSASDVLSTATQESVTDGVSVGDFVSESVVATESTEEGVDLGDTADDSVTVRESVTDGVTVGDSASSQSSAVVSESVFDGVDVGDAVGENIVATESVTDGVTVGDSQSNTAAGVSSEGVSDGVDVGDSVTDSAVVRVSVTDGVSLGDNASSETAGISTESVEDGVSVGDSVSVNVVSGPQTVQVSVTDGVNLGDSAKTNDLTTSIPKKKIRFKPGTGDLQQTSRNSPGSRD